MVKDLILSNRNTIERLGDLYGITYYQYFTFYKQSGKLKKCPKKKTLRDKFLKIETLEHARRQWDLGMLCNSRQKAIKDLRTSFKIINIVYKEKLKKEKDRLKKQVLKGKKNLEQIDSANVKFFDMKFKSKKSLTESFYWNAKNGELKWLRDIKPNPLIH